MRSRTGMVAFTSRLEPSGPAAPAGARQQTAQPLKLLPSHQQPAKRMFLMDKIAGMQHQLQVQTGTESFLVLVNSSNSGNVVTEQASSGLRQLGELWSPVTDAASQEFDRTKLLVEQNGRLGRYSHPASALSDDVLKLAVRVFLGSIIRNRKGVVPWTVATVDARARLPWWLLQIQWQKPQAMPRPALVAAFTAVCLVATADQLKAAQQQLQGSLTAGEQQLQSGHAAAAGELPVRRSGLTAHQLAEVWGAAEFHRAQRDAAAVAAAAAATAAAALAVPAPAAGLGAARASAVTEAEPTAQAHAAVNNAEPLDYPGDSVPPV